MDIFTLSVQKVDAKVKKSKNEHPTGRKYAKGLTIFADSIDINLRRNEIIASKLV